MIYPLLFYEMVTAAVYVITGVLYELAYEFAPIEIWWYLPARFEDMELLVTAAGAVLAGIPMLLWYLHLRRRQKEALVCGEYEMAQPEPFGHAAAPDTGTFFLLAGLGVCLCILVNAILLELPVSWENYEEFSEALYGPSVPVQLLCVGLLIPAAEELIFRGLIYYRIRNLLPALPCILMTALYFSVIHGNPVQGIYAFAVGVVLAGVTEWYGTLTAPYMVHASANMMSVVLSNTVLGVFLDVFRPGRLAVIVVCAALCILMFQKIKR